MQAFTRSRRVLALCVASVLSVLGVITVAVPAAADTASIPVTVTASPLTALVNGTSVAIHVDAQSPPNPVASQIFGVDARICLASANIQNAGDFNPTQGSFCAGHPLAGGSDAFVQTSVAAPYKTADLSFRVGVGTDSYTNDNGDTVLIACGPANPCNLVVKLYVPDTAQNPGGLAFKSFPLSYVGAPGAPTGAAAVAGNGAASVTWVAPASNGGSPITSYTVTANPGGHTCTRPAAPLTCTVSGLTNGTSYQFSVAATNVAGAGPSSGPTAAVVVGTPVAPSGVAAVPGNGSMTVKWLAPNANGSPLTGYVVTPYYLGVAQPTVAAGPAATSVTIPGLVNGRSYAYKVRATNAVGTGAYSALSAVVKVGTPTPPGFPTATAGNAQVALRWLASSPNASPVTGYVVTPYLGLVAQAPITFASTAVTQTVTGLVNGKTYTFKIAAINAVGTGPVSVTAGVTVGAPLAPAAPTAVAGAGKATVSWSAPADNGSAITGYVVVPYIGTVAQAPRTFASTVVSQIVTGLTPGTTYTFRVAAINARGTGSRSVGSNAVTVT
jgi:hypothetical protein